MGEAIPLILSIFAAPDGQKRQQELADEIGSKGSTAKRDGDKGKGTRNDGGRKEKVGEGGAGTHRAQAKKPETPANDEGFVEVKNKRLNTTRRTG